MIFVVPPPPFKKKDNTHIFINYLGRTRLVQNKILFDLPAKGHLCLNACGLRPSVIGYLYRQTLAVVPEQVV